MLKPKPRLKLSNSPLLCSSSPKDDSHPLHFRHQAPTNKSYKNLKILGKNIREDHQANFFIFPGLGEGPPHNYGTADNHPLKPGVNLAAAL